MKNSILGLALLYISFVFYSCYSPRYIYSPPIQDVPSLNKKNDAEISAFYAGTFDLLNKKGDNSYGFDMHAAWAFSNHFAAIIHETIQRENNDANDTYFYGDTSALSYKINATEIGAGYFSSLTENNKMRFQAFAGAAFGSLQIGDAYVSGNVFTNKFYNSKVTKFFVQPSFLYNATPNFSTALSSRFTELLFTHIKTNYTKEEEDNYILDSVGTAPVFFWEPAITYTFSLKKFPIKFRLQGTLAVLINHQFVQYKTANVGVGLVATIDKKRRSRMIQKTYGL